MFRHAENYTTTTDDKNNNLKPMFMSSWVDFVNLYVAVSSERKNTFFSLCFGTIYSNAYGNKRT